MSTYFQLMEIHERKLKKEVCRVTNPVAVLQFFKMLKNTVKWRPLLSLLVQIYTAEVCNCQTNNNRFSCTLVYKYLHFCLHVFSICFPFIFQVERLSCFTLLWKQYFTCSGPTWKNQRTEKLAFADMVYHSMYVNVWLEFLMELMQEEHEALERKKVAVWVNHVRQKLGQRLILSLDTFSLDPSIC